MRKYWNEKEKELLRKLYEDDGLAPSEIAKIMNRTVSSIAIKCQRWKFKHNKEQKSNVKSRLLTGEKNGMFGKTGPNKGLNKENSERIKIAAEKLSETRKNLYKAGILPSLSGENNPMFGKEPWNKELDISDERIKNYAQKCSITKKRQWEEKSEQEKDKIRKYMAFIGAKCKKKDTTIEIKVKKYLKSINEKFIKGYALDKFIFDFFMPDYNLVIECQGDYWHANPLEYDESNINEIQRKNIERDKRKKEFIRINNIDNLFIWENDIKKNFEKVKQMIKDKINAF